MTKRIGLILLLIFIVPIFACASPRQELVVYIKDKKAAEALQIANRKGAAQGYSVIRNNIKKGYSLLNFKDDSTGDMMNFNIKIKIDRSEDPVTMIITGKDDGDQRRDDLVLDHMEYIAIDVKDCCGIPED